MGTKIYHRSMFHEDLWRVFERAKMVRDVSNEKEEILFNFSHLLLSFLVSDDPVSRWFQETLRHEEQTVGNILEGEGIESEAFRRIANAELADLPEDLNNVSGSSEQVIDTAENYANSESSGGLIDTRHVLGAYLFEPPGRHAAQMKVWGLHREVLAESFLSFLEGTYLSEIDMWVRRRESAVSELVSLSVLKDFRFSEEIDILIKELSYPAAKSDAPLPLTTSRVLYSFLLNSLGNTSGSELGTFFADNLTDREQAHLRELQSEYMSENRWTGNFDPATMTDYMQQIFQLSTNFAQRTTGEPTIFARHLLAGFLFHSPFRVETGSQYIFRQLEIEPVLLAVELVPLVSDQFPSDNIAAWNKIIGLEADLVRPDYLADSADGEDYLNIDQDIDPLAALIAARSTEPPLAIGVFGDWGSGKTFFMRRLRRRIDLITDRMEKFNIPQNQTEFYKRIAQIEFNAWHYMESNLWASLVEHIFSSLQQREAKATEKQKKHLEIQLKEETRAVQLARNDQADADKLLKDAEAELDTVEQEFDTAKRELENVSAQDVFKDIAVKDLQLDDEITQKLEELGLKATFEDVKELRAALAGLRSHYARPWVEIPSLEDRRLLYVGLLLLVPLIAGIGGGIANQLVNNETIAAIIGLLSGLVVAAAEVTAVVRGALRKGIDWINTRAKDSQVLSKIDAANSRLDTLVETKNAEKAGKIEVLEQTIRQLNVRYAAAKERVIQHEQRILELNAALRALRPDQVFVRFIEDRVNSDDYRKHLGMLALIRHDFETLSKSIQDINDAIRIGEKLDEACYNRIVLYIDDLDRCPPEKVVEVLRAVHLLLAFPLFVVVVGVDARWVSYSLRRHYRGLLSGAITHLSGEIHGLSPRATPFEYLEKIFQLPLWLQPIGTDGTTRLLEGLLKSSLVVEPEEVPAEQTGQMTETDRTGDAGPTGGSAEPQPSDAVQPRSQPDNLIEANPEVLQILSTELKFMEQLSPIMGRSPRAVKRFVNTYRLIKARQGRTLHSFLAREKREFNDFKGVMFLLAVVIGMPHVSNAFFDNVSAGYSDRELSREEQRTIPSAIDALTDASTEDRTLLTECVNKLNWQDVPLWQLARWADDVARYSFRIKQIPTMN